jgi:drug/metabolite transporter (DMT)-like permease
MIVKDGTNTSYGMLLLTMLFWGGNWPALKILTSYLMVPPLTLGFFRYLTASFLFIILLIALRRPLSQLYCRENAKILAIAGMTYFACSVTLIIGMSLTTGAQASIIAGFNSATVGLFAYLMHKERLTKTWHYLGYILSFLGILFVIGIQAFIEFQINYFIGNILILVSGLIWGLYSSIGKTAMKTMSSIDFTAGSIAISCTFFGIGSLSEGIWMLDIYGSLDFWLNILFIGIGVTFLGFMFYFKAIENIGASRASSFISLVPVVGTTLSILLLQENVYWTFIIGLIFVVAGIALINQSKNS